MNDSTREIGAALGIAVMGTFLATGFRSGIEDATEGLPPELAELTDEGIGATYRVAEIAGRPDLIEPAQEAFMDGLAVAFWIGAVACLAAAVIVFASYPKRGQEPAAVEDAPMVPSRS